MRDNEVSEKMEQLNALSGGIVFGKEAAWDKLQARLDKPVAAKRVLWPKLSAAAAVLCLIMAGIYYYTLNPVEIAQLDRPAILQTPIKTEPATATEMEVPTTTTEEKLQTADRKELPSAKYIVTVPPELPVEENEPVATVEVAQEVAVVAPPAPTTNPISKMKVVHINDTEPAANIAAEQAVAHNGPTLDINKMKVVSIYDAEREARVLQHADEVLTIVRTGRPRSALLKLPYPLSRSNTMFSSVAQNPLRIRLNRNN